jgi:hypothetical protein
VQGLVRGQGLDQMLQLLHLGRRVGQRVGQRVNLRVRLRASA